MVVSNQRYGESESDANNRANLEYAIAAQRNADERLRNTPSPGPKFSAKEWVAAFLSLAALIIVATILVNVFGWARDAAFSFRDWLIESSPLSSMFPTSGDTSGGYLTSAAILIVVVAGPLIALALFLRRTKVSGLAWFVGGVGFLAIPALVALSLYAAQVLPA